MEGFIGDFEELRRDDLIRVNIVDGERKYAGSDGCELGHSLISDFRFWIYDFPSLRGGR